MLHLLYNHAWVINMEKQREKKEFNIFMALLPLLLMITAMGTAVIWLGQDPHLPLIFGTASAAIVALFYGYKWKEIEDIKIIGKMETIDLTKVHSQSIWIAVINLMVVIVIQIKMEIHDQEQNSEAHLR